MRTKRMIARVFLFLFKLLLAAAAVVLICRLGEAAYQFGSSIYGGQSVSAPPGRDVAVVLPEGVTAGRAAEILEAQGLIKDRWVFVVQERLSKYHGQIEPGDYVLNTSWNADRLLAVLSGHAQDMTEEEESE